VDADAGISRGNHSVTESPYPSMAASFRRLLLSKRIDRTFNARSIWTLCRNHQIGLVEDSVCWLCPEQTDSAPKPIEVLPRNHFRTLVSAHNREIRFGNESVNCFSRLFRARKQP